MPGPEGTGGGVTGVGARAGYAPIVLAAAVLPNPPLLVPALAGAGAGSLAPLLSACDRTVSELLAAATGSVLLIGPGRSTVRHDADAWGSLDGFGVRTGEPARHDDTQPRLPLSLTIGRWLLDRAGWNGDLEMQEVAGEASAEECAALAGQLAGRLPDGTAWLVMGEGSICRGPRSPGYDDPRAEGFDAGVAAALATADLSGLLGLDVRVAAELGAAGRPAWQVLAAAARAHPPVAAELHYNEAPFGVGYFVAGWRFAA